MRISLAFYIWHGLEDTKDTTGTDNLAAVWTAVLKDFATGIAFNCFDTTSASMQALVDLSPTATISSHDLQNWDTPSGVIAAAPCLVMLDMMVKTAQGIARCPPSDLLHSIQVSGAADRASLAQSVQAANPGKQCIRDRQHIMILVKFASLLAAVKYEAESKTAATRAVWQSLIDMHKQAGATALSTFEERPSSVQAELCAHSALLLKMLIPLTRQLIHSGQHERAKCCLELCQVLLMDAASWQDVSFIQATAREMVSQGKLDLTRLAAVFAG